MAERGLPLRAGPKEIIGKKTCVAMASSDVKPKSISRAKKWSEEIENLYRFQQAGYRDEIEYKQVKQVSMVDRWPETGYVKKLQRRDNTFYYYNKQRECDDKEVHKSSLPVWMAYGLGAIINRFKSVLEADQRFYIQRGIEFGTGQKVPESSNFIPFPQKMESRDKAETTRTPVISRTISADYIVFRNEKVVNCLYQNRNAIFRLVCFPWGGGGSTFFAKWGQDIPNSMEVHAIRLAGRESRLDEPFASDMHQVVDEIACALLPIIQGENFAFFGHSMGSCTAFFTALHLKEKYNLEPVHLFVSSISPPHAQLHFLEDDMCDERIAFLVKKMGVILEDFVGDEELSQESDTKVLADLHILKDVICGTHSKTRLSCDITCFSGSEDLPVDMEAWKDVTSGNFDSFVLPGHHFYLLEPSNTSFIKEYITKSLEISALAP